MVKPPRLAPPPPPRPPPPPAPAAGRAIARALDAEGAAAERHLAGRGIPGGEGDHAGDAVECGAAAPPQEAQEPFGVALGAEALAPRLEVPPQFAVVEDLAIVG